MESIESCICGGIAFRESKMHGKTQVIDMFYEHCVKCTWCGCQSHYHKEFKNAIKEWNKFNKPKKLKNKE